MNTAGFCIKHRVATILSVILICVFGVMFGTQLQMALMPSMEMPMAAVICTYPGATPADIEELVVEPLESAIMSVSGVDEIQSTSSENMGMVMITYLEGTDTDIAATKLREKFNTLNLPDDASSPTIVNMNMDELMPTAMIALMGNDLAQLQILAEDIVAPALERIDGVAQVTVSGGIEEEISVEIDTSRAAGLGLSNSYISQILAAQNLLYPAGDMNNGNKTITVSTDAKFQSVDDVANTLIPLPTGGTVRLSEVAKVSLVAKDMEAVSKVGQTNAVFLQVSKQSGANEMEAANAVVARLEELQADNPNVQYYIPYIASDYINESVDAAFTNIWQGILLAAAVVFLFLRRIGSTITISLSMPVCILTVFLLMKAMGLTLNMMSLGGIAIGIGMIVDNSIVVLENINRFFQDGHDRKTACIDGTKEVTSSIIAGTLTTEAVFVPLGLTSGMVGSMFHDFCLTIASLLAASLVIALTLVPLMCYLTLNEEKRDRQLAQAAQANKKKTGIFTQFFHTLSGIYQGLLNFFLNHLKLGMLVSLALVILFALPLSGTTMVMTPSMDQGQVSVTISMPTGSELSETTAIADRVAAIVEAECPEMTDMYYLAQNGGSSMMSSGDVTMGINLVDKSERTRSAFDIEDDLRLALRDIAGCEITVSATSTMSTSGSDISLEISGDDYDILSSIARDLTRQISALPDAVNVETSVSDLIPQVKVTLNREAVSQYGLTAAGVGAAVRAELTGTEATTVTINNKDYSVMVRGNGTAASSLDALRSMPIDSAFGGTVPLSAIANVDIVQAPTSISRANQTRQVTITGDTISGDSTAITEQINAILADYPLPEGYTAETAGAFEDMMESFADLLLALVVAVALVYFVLAAQFESFSLPCMVMMILPVSFTGALFALPLTGRDLSMISLIGIVMLAGTVVNSSIILIEYIKIRRDMGEDRKQAILNACPLRVRPIMMTTLTTVISMIPMALGIGGTNEMMSDMGVVMISGMIVSTLVTLLFTPVFYSVIDDMSHFGRRKKRNQPTPVADAV